MQYNIFKVTNKELLMSEMCDNGYETNNKIINSGNYELKLYYRKKDNSLISWQNILNTFGVDITIDKDNLKGILIADNGIDVYAITYGMSSALVQKYCDSEYPMDIAKRVEVSKVKRKASKILNGSTNSLVRTLTNSDLIVVDKGESVVNLELIPDDKENLGKCIGIGKSVRINIDEPVESIESIINLLNDINERTEKRPIPLFIKLKKDELVNEIWEYLNKNFCEKIEEIRTRLPRGRFGSDFLRLVPVTGLEPVRCCQRGILSPLRLPIPPHRRVQRALLYHNARGFSIIRTA